MSPFNNWYIINSTNKTTCNEYSDEINKVVLSGISDNVSFLVQTVKYGANITNNYYLTF